ncbi:MAG TPA: VOC family protein [Cyclobacteriaceae bacterium]|nr:VOC family protein [Cyclobacteriaceae bacterium]HMV08754.1 VOC family protein [Cyclobacteriaceae bacterium]HMV90212.1 VOC family protein [Cyclobacteriaceae bacterium]HMW99899.1 VOC family protein [Cyclobacteriaceae bacterium]HMX49238.1 VOC family protein [Cyclobacteriaceae bacterium]
MITSVIPKLPYINKQKTADFYKVLGFTITSDYPDYLIATSGKLELHFFSFPSLEPSKSDFMIYLRVDDIDTLYENVGQKLSIHTNGKLETKSWGQREFSMTDPNGTLITFGQAV